MFQVMTYHERRRAAGRCMSCPAYSGDEARCAGCKAKRRQRHVERKKKRVCADCGNKNPTKRSRCPTCLKKKRDLYDYRKANGICVKCGKKPAENGKHACSDCKLNNRKRDARKNAKLRAQVLVAYGSKCACPGCTVTEPKFLQVDHVNNDGAAHRRRMFGNNKNGGGIQLYTYLRRLGFPKKGFQLMCANCNFAKGHYGKCPHED